MKSMGSGVILKSGLVTPVECLHYALNEPTSVVITGIDSPQVLDRNIEAARTLQPMDRQAVEALLAKTVKAASDGQYELFKTTQHFDSTAQHPDYLGGELPRTKELTKSS